MRLLAAAGIARPHIRALPAAIALAGLLAGAEAAQGGSGAEARAATRQPPRVVPPGPLPPAGAFAWPKPPGPLKPRIECVAHELDPAADLPDLWYDVVASWGGIDAAGNVLFCAYLDGPGVTGANDQAMFYGAPGNVRLVIREGDPVPDAGDQVVLASLYYSAENLSQDGQIAFTALVSGPGITAGVNDGVLYVGTPTEFHKLRQSGDPAPDCPGYTLHNPSANFSAHGILLVYDYLHPDFDRMAAWIGRPDNLQFVYVDYMQAPGCAPGVFFAGIDCVVHNDAGEIGFRGLLGGPGVVYEVNDLGHWQGGPGGLQKISRSGEAAVGVPGGITYKNTPLYLALNGSGCLASLAYLQGSGVTSANDLVLYFGSEDGLYLVLREGDPAPPGIGVEVTVGPGTYALVNDRGEGLWSVKYSGPGITPDNAWAVVFGSPGATRQVLRDGQSVIGVGRDATVAGVAALPGAGAMNRVGDIIGPTWIEGPGVTSDNDLVLWMWHHIVRRWVPLLRTGDIVDGRTICAASQLIDFADGYSYSTGGGDGHVQCFNDRGMLAMGLNFTDGTAGLYRISPPAFADGDGDGDVDARDLGLAQACLIGVENQVSEQCAVFDLDEDGDVDLADFAMVQQFVGP